VLLRAPQPRAALLLLVLAFAVPAVAAPPAGPSVDPEAGSGPIKLPDAPLGPLAIAIDVVPGDASNVLIAGSDEGIPVALLSSPEFDATEVEPATLVLAGAPVARGANQRPFSQLMDVDEDGRLDLLVQFPARAVSPEADGTVRLRGRSESGQELEGIDVVVIAEPGGIEAVGPGRSGRARESADLDLRVFPNPSRGALGVSLSLAGPEAATVDLLDVTGRRVDSRVVPAAAGRAAFAWPARFAPGRYVVRVTQGSRVLTKPVTVLR